MHPVKVTIDIDLEHRAGMVSGSARLGGFCLKTQSRDIEAIDKDIDDSNHAVLFDIFINAFREQGGLVSVLALDKSAHGSTLNWKSVFYLLARSFHTASAMNGPSSCPFGWLLILLISPGKNNS
jgi:hypothetical protein